MDQKQFVGAIPTPTPKPVNNSKHLECWKTLEEIAYRHNVDTLKKWLQLQTKKLDIYKKKSQINPKDFILGKGITPINIIFGSQGRIRTYDFCNLFKGCDCHFHITQYLTIY